MSIADQLERNMRDRVRRNLDQSRTVLVSLITAPINSISGQLVGGVVVDAWSESGDTYESTARSLAPYSLFVDKGTGELGPAGGRIYPVNARALHFYWYKRGEWVTFKSVRGSPPLNFFSEPLPQNFADALRTVWGP